MNVKMVSLDEKYRIVIYPTPTSKILVDLAPNSSGDYYFWAWCDGEDTDLSVAKSPKEAIELATQWVTDNSKPLTE